MASVEETIATEAPAPESDKTRSKIRYTLELTPESYDVLERLVSGTNSTNKSEVLRKAIALMSVAVEAKQNGQKLYISDSPPEGSSREIIGI